jgi:hypothetical protein
MRDAVRGYPYIWGDYAFPAPEAACPAGCLKYEYRIVSHCWPGTYRAGAGQALRAWALAPCGGQTPSAGRAKIIPENLSKNSSDFSDLGRLRNLATKDTKLTKNSFTYSSFVPFVSFVAKLLFWIFGEPSNRSKRSEHPHLFDKNLQKSTKTYKNRQGMTNNDRK